MFVTQYFLPQDFFFCMYNFLNDEYVRDPPIPLI